MDLKKMIQMTNHFLDQTPNNYINLRDALSPELAGMQIFEESVFGIADAGDPLFLEMKKETVIGKHYMCPQEWLPNARSVISYFLPFSNTIRNSNGKDYRWPSKEWLHGRIEGQALILDLSRYLADAIETTGFESIIPAIDERYRKKDKPPVFTSNWSERHAAFVAGLGTFSLSKGMITVKGTAGRFGSLITTMPIPVTLRSYDTLEGYCNHCGVCASQCPATAITLEEGKNHEKCGAYIDETAKKFNPRFGCGKCQVNVPCEKMIPQNAQQFLRK